ncbi:cobalamin biosynthesis protein CbiB [Parashewanella curva]|uniref:Cobalamin biosynthesis protein CbiB n=1 Tax=Parashewanella curva TaxID=2338552 RepID=A0A3L8Q3X3_9GAMM|nr:cobalamin biosynthesis protein [Parashewanella curva]RLV61712.1 cobalamin biosynthesis protein CbiB [Parashewanella curva]
MQDALVNLIEQNLAYYQQAAILFVALIIAHFIQLPRLQQPLFLFGKLAKQFATHVNHPQRALSQRKIAGCLSVILLILPFALLIYFFISLAHYPWFFEFLIIYLCLQDTRIVSDSTKIAQLCHQQKKDLARQKLAHWTERDTRSLSLIGINKACIETSISSAQYNFISVIFAFIIGGVPLVLTYKMLHQLDEAWPINNPKFQGFNYFLYHILRVFNFIPSIIFSGMMAVTCGWKGLKIWLQQALIPQHIGQPQLTFALVATKLNIELGGPQLFNGIRVNQAKYCSGPAPTPQHIIDVAKLLSKIELFIIAALLTRIVFFPLSKF